MKKRKIPIFMGLMFIVLLITAGAAFTQDRINDVTAVTSRAASVIAAPVAQEDDPDLSNDGTFARVHLQGGFNLDPYVLRIMGGSGEDAASLDEICVGEIGAVPNAVLDWSGESEQLSIFVYSDHDATLVVKTPDGTVLCNDDADGLTLDPLITLDNPAEGNYEIFVGSIGSEGPAHGVVGFTELDISDDMATLDLAPLLDRRDRPDPEDVTLPTIDLSRLRVTEDPAFGGADLEEGFEPVTVVAIAGGEHPVFGESENGDICAGFFSIVPAYSFDWEGGDISVHFEGESNTSLLIVTPDDVACNDNSSGGNLNPDIDLTDAPAGQYDVHIGSFSPNGVVLGALTITSESGAAPVSLSADE